MHRAVNERGRYARKHVSRCPPRDLVPAIVAIVPDVVAVVDLTSRQRFRNAAMRRGRGQAIPGSCEPGSFGDSRQAWVVLGVMVRADPQEVA